MKGCSIGPIQYDDTVLREGAAALGLALTDEQLGAFARYYALLMEENEAAGLTTVVEPSAVQGRHFLESLALGAVLARAGVSLEGASAVDLGSGAGFPGVPLAIATPTLRVVLVESHGRRAGFLLRLVNELGLHPRLRVVNARAEDAARLPEEREGHDFAFARALAPMPVLAELALPFLRVGGVLAAIKGSRAREEIVSAELALWELGGGAAEVLALPALPGDGPWAPSVVLVRKERPTAARYPRRAGVPQRRPLGSRG